MTGLLNLSSERVAADNQFRLWKDGEVIAACPTYEAHNAARRLLGQAS